MRKVNAHFWNCLKYVVSGCPSGFAVAVSAAKKNVRVCQHHPSHSIPTLRFVPPASTAHANAYFLKLFSLRQLTSYQLKYLYSSRLTCLFCAVGLLSMIYFCRSEGLCLLQKNIKGNDILIDLCKPPLHFSCSKRSKKLFIVHVEQVQGERHAKFGEKARMELEKSAAKREGCVGRSPRFGLVKDFRTSRVCSRVYRDHPVEHHTQLICLWSAPGV